MTFRSRESGSAWSGMGARRESWLLFLLFFVCFFPFPKRRLMWLQFLAHSSCP
jgi:hypothetical protein